MKSPDKLSNYHSEVIVDLDNIRSNLDFLRKRAGGTAGVMAVVKANAYGHGSVEVVRALGDRVEWLAVNDVEEGIELREAGIELPILVFGVPEEGNAEAYVSHNLTATVSRPVHFDLLEKGTGYHLNFDTGMGRLGLLPGEVHAVREKMDQYDGLNCTGIYTHLATADAPESEKAYRQLEQFRQLRAKFPDGLRTHVGNTGGALYYEGSVFDLVRVGIGLYGYPPSPADVEGLKPALAWKSRLVQVKPVARGDTVSYGGRWQAPGDGFIGVVPVGYGDGLRRALSGKIHVRIEGEPYPQVGTITMNYFMVFLGKDKIDPGTEVTILDTERLTAGKMAQKLDTISYEILVSIDRRITRRYLPDR